MDKITEFFTSTFAEYSTMKFLIAEIFICLLAASVLGLIIGWLCKSAFAREKFREQESDWQFRQRGLEAEHQSALDTFKSEKDQLTEQVQSLETHKISLNSSLEANKSAVHKAHIEVQQLSKKQKETHERLQKMLTDKDREISQLQAQQSEFRQGKDNPPKPFGVSKPKAKNNKPASPVSRITSTIGGKPDSHAETGSHFKPGTQARNEDFDQTQLLDSTDSDLYPSPAAASYNDPLRDATASDRDDRARNVIGANQAASNSHNAGTAERSSNAGSNEAHRTEQKQSSNENQHQFDDSTDAQSDASLNEHGQRDLGQEDFGTSANDTLDETSILDFSSHDDTAQITSNYGTPSPEFEAEPTPTTPKRRAKKSLWDRVKTSVSKTVDKTKL